MLDSMDKKLSSSAQTKGSREVAGRAHRLLRRKMLEGGAARGVCLGLSCRDYDM